MRSFVESCLEAAGLAGASYADVRVVDTTTESMSVGSGRLEGVESSASLGFGIRVIADGAWGFASSSEMTEDAAFRVARQAVAIAKASSLALGAPLRLSALEPATGTWRGQCEIDPFGVSFEDKLGLLLRAEEGLRTQDAVKATKAHLDFLKVSKVFGSSEGAYIEQSYVESGGGIVAYAVAEGEVQPRSYPNSHGGGWAQAGWEYILGLDLAGNAPRVAEEAAALLTAEECPSATTDVIIMDNQLSLQVHESIGHPLELDRVLGDEAAFAGTSWVGVGDLGSLRYGSDNVTVTADSTIAGSLGSFGWDDEGVPSQRDTLIDRGTLAGFLTSRESALALGRTSNGAMRADGWNRIPIIRMTTVSLEPGTWKLGDLVADTDDGILFDTNNSWSIDDKRLNFQFGCEVAWEIKNGERGRMLKNPNYTGITPRFWGSCDAVCDRDHWQVWGLANCGKGEPMQVAHVAHGAAPARFRSVTVGVGR